MEGGGIDSSITKTMIHMFKKVCSGSKVQPGACEIYKLMKIHFVCIADILFTIFAYHNQSYHIIISHVCKLLVKTEMGSYVHAWVVFALML